VPLVFVATPFICVWMGEDAAVPPFGLLVCIAGWSVINASMSAVSCLLSASGRIKTQMFYARSTATLNIVLSIVLIRVWGFTGVIAGTVLSYVVCNGIPVLIDANGVLRRLTRRLQGEPTGNELIILGEGAQQI
jgi:Na+-driven multidrug efflux pump